MQITLLYPKPTRIHTIMKGFKSTLFSSFALLTIASAGYSSDQDNAKGQRYCPPAGWTFDTQMRAGYTTFNSSYIAGTANETASDSSENVGPALAFSQTVGYKEAFSLRITGRGALPYTSPEITFGQEDGYIANAEALISIPFVANRESSLIFMPSIGFGWMQHYRKIVSSGNLKDQSQARFFAPSAGLLLSFMPASALTIKGGIFFTFPFGKHKASLVNPASPSDNYTYPYMKLHRRRHGINAELEMAYKINSSVSIVTKGEWNTLSAEGNVTPSAGPELDENHTVYAMSQYTVSMGINFSY